MKKILSLALLFAFLFSFVGCDPTFYYFKDNYLLENTVKIELYDYKNDAPRKIDRREEMPVFDFSKATLLKTLERPEIELLSETPDETTGEAVAKTPFEELLDFLSTYGYAYYSTCTNEPVGKTIVLHLKDGNMIVFYGCRTKNDKGRKRTFGDCIIFDQNGVFLDYMGETWGNFSMDTAVYFE